MIDKETKELYKRLDQITKSINDLNKTIKLLPFSVESLTEECRRISEAYRKSIEEKLVPLITTEIRKKNYFYYR